MQVFIATIDSKTGVATKKAVALLEGSRVCDLLKTENITLGTESISLFCHKVSLETVLAEGDRIDIGTPLKIDPKEARKIRAKSAKFTSQPLLARHGGKHQLVK